MGENRKIITIEIKMRGHSTKVLTRECMIKGSIDSPRLVPVTTYTKIISRRESRT